MVGASGAPQPQSSLRVAERRMVQTLRLRHHRANPTNPMSWPLSLVVAFLNAVLGCVGAFAVASLGVSWYRITSREGASGYFVVGMGFVGLVVGALIGLIVARVVAGMAEPSFLKGWGYASAVTGALLLLITAFSWLNADFAPKLEGKYLEVEVEVLCPPSWGKPTEKRGANHYVTLTADEGGRRQLVGNVDFAAGKLVDGRWLVSAFVPLQTTSAGKSLGVSLNKAEDQYLRPSIPSRPSHKDFEWSSWLTNTTTAQLKPVPPENAFAVRYRVRFDSSVERAQVVEDKNTSQEKARQAEFERLDPNAPLAEWLKYADWGEGGNRLELAAQKIAARPNFVEELGAALESSDRPTVARALLVIDQLYTPPKEFGPPVVRIAEQIERDMLASKAKPSTEQVQDALHDLEVFFGKWTSAGCALHEKSNVDMLPSVQRIAAAAADYGEHYTLGSIGGSAGAYVGRWTAPGGPKPARMPQ